MKNEVIFNAIGKADDKYIKEAAPGKPKETQKRPWVKWGALAACLALAVITFIKIIPENPVEPAPGLDDLPMLVITEDSGEAMGFEGYMAYDISEIVNNNPWT